MSYPAPITGTVFDSPSEWTNSLGGPYTNGVSGVRYLFYLREAGVFPNVIRTLTAWKSTDSGETWAIVDNGNSPVIGATRSGITCYGTVHDPNPATNVVWCSFPDTVGLINSGLAPTWRANFAFQSFNMDTDSWGAKVGAGPQMFAQVGDSSDSFVFQNALYVYANGDVQAFYQGPPETVSAKDRDRAYTALYSGGVWGVGQSAFGAGEARDYAPCNLVAGDAGRVHLFATGSTNFVAVFNARKLYQNTLTAQVLAGQQLVSQDIIPGPSNGGGQFVSSAVTRPNGGSTELLVAYIRPATGNANSFTGFPAIARANSADTPVWTLENINSTLAIASTEQFAGVPVLVSGSDITVAWSGLDSVFPFPSYINYSVNSGGGWGAAVLLYTDPNGEIGSEELNGLGLGSSGWGLVFADSGVGELDYFEFAGAAPSLGITCDSPPEGEVGAAYSHFFPATGGTEPYAFAITSGVLPGGLSLDAGTGEVSGVPTLAGVYPFTVQVTDADDDTAEVECSIEILGAVSVTCNNPPRGHVGTPYDHIFLASAGSPPYTFSLDSGTLPTNTSLDPSSGELTGTPTQSGVYEFTIRVTDSLGGTSVTGTCSILIKQCVLVDLT